MNKKEVAKMEEQAAIDRILETENLTDNLEDQEANWLLDWGIKRVPGVIGGIADDEVAGTQVNELMAVMRQVNQLIAGRDSKTEAELAGDIQALAESYERAFGSARKASPDECRSFAGQIVEKPALEALQVLIGWLAPSAQG
jgi:hypothetical protein